MNKTLLLLTLALTTAFVLFKLDYRSFFTDELAYYYDGREIVNLNDYSKNKEVPPVGKYLAGMAYLIGNRNVFLLRLPFTLMLLISAFVVYLIIKQFYDEIWAVIGSAIFAEIQPWIAKNLHGESKVITLADLTGLSPFIIFAILAVLIYFGNEFVKKYENPIK